MAAGPTGTEVEELTCDGVAFSFCPDRFATAAHLNQVPFSSSLTLFPFSKSLSYSICG